MHGNESTLAVPSSSVVLPCYCSYIFLPKCFSGLCSLIVGNFYVYARAGIQYFTKLGLYVQGSVAFFGAFPHNIIASITVCCKIICSRVFRRKSRKAPFRRH